MNNIPVDDGLRRAFDDASLPTAGQVRAILVQNDGKALHLVNTLLPSSTDREDFEPVLEKLFTPDPNRSGYALFRLDSQAASGEWEWICCAYQPDGAKIKEKMQYALTRASLMAGLTERRFLDTIFGSTPRDFNWPTKLRNSRKHDYQNPQLKTAGVSAAEAAGTGSGGARRTFGARSGLANMLRAAGEGEAAGSGNGDGSGVEESQPAAAPAVPPAAAPEHSASVPSAAVAEDARPVDDKPTAMPAPKRFNSHLLTNAFKDPGLEEKAAAKEHGEAPAAPAAASEAVSQDDEAAVAPSPAPPMPPADLDGEAERNAVEEPSTPSIAAGQADSLSQPTVPSAKLVSASVAVQEAEESHQPTSEQLHRQEERAEAKNPSQPSTPSLATQVEGRPGQGPLSQPTVPSSTYLESRDDVETANGNGSAPSASAPASAPSKGETRVGYGTGPASGLTQREQDLVELRKAQAADRVSHATSRVPGGSGGGHGGPKVGFRWAEGVAEALQGLGTTASGTSEWNLVVLCIDVANETVELDEAPSFVLPADLVQRWKDEPRMAFYRFQDGKEAGGSASGESKVVMLYYCPAGSSVKSRMMYSSNVLSTLNHVKGMAGLRVVKKIESSDPQDLTHTSILAEVEEVLAKERHVFGLSSGDGIAEEAGSASSSSVLPTEELKGSFARPPRPGRR
ncbi:uncharacterized protein PFL1_02938 [Pseudozyma flocculosa PF-1]|uniref:ADF-H domain-containing protein n=2 Tax=Pseudozyma flocculosa TaxID=84751 RepID=A0A5C3F304_9BASI|nr:uncharacterized protein PFL1_02938 [Pseudozyma flocculosa PF-1]EPQ29718.1 hypothetical protein PFL1_02938 [Pseudozyma flocculosa PF-1]SPO38296.1 uncharacterized protein PSFLO_03773 [Pseudozyma flocculosa]